MASFEDIDAIDSRIAENMQFSEKIKFNWGNFNMIFFVRQTVN